MPEQPKPIPINLDPNAYALTGVNVEFGEEEFIFRLTSGNQMRGYIATPKHAKRILLLLQKQLAEYESKFGVLETSLPKPHKSTGQEKKIGF